MSKPIAFNFKLVPFAEDAFTLCEVGKSHSAMLKGSYEESLQTVELLAAVWLSMPKADRRDYGYSVVCFIDFALKHPAELDDLKRSVGPTQLGLWSETIQGGDGTLH